ncbi:MAG: homoserine dehydrogenase, partial [Anaerolineae bacterium]|nr:homoserine dehydrogenase [Anaerolineae bacterium]
MKTYRLSLVGFGNVGQALARLLMKKEAVLRDTYGIAFKVTGIATGRHGKAINPDGLNLEDALNKIQNHQSLDGLSTQKIPESMLDFIKACPADVMFENSPVNHHTGQPAVSHAAAALECGQHVVTANKGTVVHAFKELTDQAANKGLRFMFESTVMDGAPIFSLFRGTLPGAELIGFKGILNSTTNLILERMENGESFDEAVVYTQKAGLAETDPSADIDGWDASIKVAAISTVLMGAPLKPVDVDRTGIRAISPAMIKEAAAAGERWKLVCRAWRENGLVKGEVKPQRVPSTSPFYAITGSSSY